jgi:hypothetical protein
VYKQIHSKTRQRKGVTEKDHINGVEKLLSENKTFPFLPLDDASDHLRVV